MGEPEHPMVRSTAWMTLAAAILVGVAQIGPKLIDGDTMRVQDLEYFRLLRSLAEFLDLAVFSHLPVVLNRVFDLTQWPAAAAFIAVAGAGVILLFSAIAVPLTVVAVAVRAMTAKVVSPRLWCPAFPVTLFAFLTVGVLYPYLRLWAPGQLRLQGGVLLASGFIGAAILLGVVRLAGWHRAVRVAAAFGAVGAIVVVVSLPVAMFAGDRAGAAGREGPNVLLISVDTLRADHLGCYGYDRDTSPTIDRLAREGARFTTVVSSTSWTLPAHISLLTGLPSEAHGVIDTGMKASSSSLFLAEVLRDSGYATAGFVAGPFLSGSYGFLQGFEHYDDHSVLSLLQSHKVVTSPRSIQIIEDWLVSWDGQGRERPFFAFLHLWDVHYDYIPPPPYDTIFDPDYRGTITGEDFERGDHIHRDMDPRDLEHVIALYDGEIRYTDEHLARLLDLLGELDVLDETIIVLTSDHGEEFFEHGGKGHGKNLFDESILVPLIVRYPPGVRGGTVIETQVSLIDIAPTILSLAGIERPGDFAAAEAESRRAVDLAPMLNGRAATIPKLASSDLHGALKAIRSNADKLIWDVSRPRQLYFDLIADPGELVNLVGGRPERVADLQAEHLRWVGVWETGAGLAERNQIDDELRRRLRSLGYID